MTKTLGELVVKLFIISIVNPGPVASKKMKAAIIKWASENALEQHCNCVESHDGIEEKKLIKAIPLEKFKE